MFLNHNHYDHTSGNSIFVEEYGAETVLHFSAGMGNIGIKEGDKIKLGRIRLSFIHTPGHTQDSICIRAGDELVTGDTLFVGKFCY